MKTTFDKATQTRRKWLVAVGYALIGAGILLLLLLSFVLPVDWSAGPNHYYRVAPAEHGWVIAALPLGLGVLLVLMGRALRSRSR